MALLDSGADISVLPKDLAELLNLDFIWIDYPFDFFNIGYLLNKAQNFCFVRKGQITNFE